MIKIGLTGNFGCGKSTALKMFQARGVAVLDADDLARDAVAPGQPAYRRIVRRFGPDILRPDGAINRAGLAAIVFADKVHREALGAIVHPPVRRKIRDFLKACHSARKALCVVCIPLLYETGLEGWFDAVAVVKASQSASIARAGKSHGMSRSQTLGRLRAQMPLREKCRRADFVLDNGGSVLHLRRQVEGLLKKLKSHEA